MVDTDTCSSNTDKDETTNSSDDYTSSNQSDNNSYKVKRKFINSAIYVEKPLSANVSSENCSVKDLLETKTKRCTCSSDQKTCPCHANKILSLILNEKRERPTTGIISLKPQENKTKISQYTTRSDNYNVIKKPIIKKMIVKKPEEIKKKLNGSNITLEKKPDDKEKILEQERRNFEKWLMNKKKQEIEAKKKKEKELEEQQLKELEKEKRQLENQLNFQLWLRKKEEALLENKIKKQIEMITQLEQKERQLKDNEKAYNDWLKNSKNKQKPIPLNKGLKSLCASNSVTYVNPNPWNHIPE